MQNQRSSVSSYKLERLKPIHKEKFVSIYEDIFSGRSPIHTERDKGIQGRTVLTRFWDELLLLKVNQEFLAHCISTAKEEELKGKLKLVVNELFGTMVMYLSDDNFIRVAHALETMAILLQEVFKKRFVEQGLTIITLVAGSMDNAELFFKRLIIGIGTLLTRDNVPVLVKSLGLRILLTILTATDNVNTNYIATYLFVNNIFDPILSVLSSRLTEDRRRLEFDVTLVLALLLLWRESENIYLLSISSSTLSFMPLLNAIASLLSSSELLIAAGKPDTAWSVMDVISGYVGNVFGLATSAVDSNIDAEKLDMHWCNTTCGLLLLYFLLYLNPNLKSTQVWPSPESTVPASVSIVWINVIKSFFNLCKDMFSQINRLGTKVKLCLTILRCLVEDPVASNYLFHSDVEFNLRQLPESGMMGIHQVIPFISLSCLVVDLAVTVINTKALEPYMDPDLYYRAALLIPIVLNGMRTRGLQIMSSSISWSSLWQALITCCRWCGDEKIFLKPGAPELADMVVSTLEACLGMSQDICGATEDTEVLHAAVMSHTMVIEKLVQVAAANPFGSVGKSTIKDYNQLVNVAAIRYHYEVQIAALGVRGQPTFEQALAGIRRKGFTSLRLKPKHAGPGHPYVEGTAEIRMLSNLVRVLATERRKQLYSGLPKLDMELL